MNRKGFIGGSDVVKIMDKNKWYELWEVKTGRKESEDLSNSIPVQVGITTESLNLKLFQDNVSQPYSNTFETEYQSTYGIKYSSFVPLKCIADWLVYDSSGNLYIVEAKHTYDRNTMRNVTETYMPQVQTYMHVFGVEYCYLSVLFGNNRHEAVKINYSPNYFKEIMRSVVEFWTHVHNNIPPQKTSEPLKVVATDDVLIDDKIAVDKSSNNEFMNSVHTYLDKKEDADLFDTAKKTLLSHVTDDIHTAYCDKLEITRSKTGRRSIKVLNKKENVA